MTQNAPKGIQLFLLATGGGHGGGASNVAIAWRERQLRSGARGA